MFIFRNLNFGVSWNDLFRIAHAIQYTLKYIDKIAGTLLAYRFRFKMKCHMFDLKP